jgi:hypothetical protein
VRGIVLYATLLSPTNGVAREPSKFSDVANGLPTEEGAVRVRMEGHSSQGFDVRWPIASLRREVSLLRDHARE